MPLTNAERQKKYREKVKNDPEKYIRQKEKDLERAKKNIQLKRLQISEMDEDAKQKQREIWRQKKRLQRKKKKDKEKTESTIEATKEPTATAKSTSKSDCHERVIAKYQQLKRKYRTALDNVKKLSGRLVTYRKYHSRVQISLKEEIERLKDNINKMKAREEILETSLSNSYKQCRNSLEKYAFKNIISENSVKINKKVRYITKLLGFSGHIKRKKITISAHLRSLRIKKEVESFFLRDDISRSTSGKKECRTFKKEKKQIRYLVDSLNNLFKIYKEEGGNLSFSTFYKYKPFYVLSPNVTCRETCLCVKHSNIQMLFDCLKKHKIIDYPNMTQLIKALVCDKKSRKCMFNECTTCKDNKIEYKLESQVDVLSWKKWELVEHEYNKLENGNPKLVKTKKTVKSIKTGSIEQLIFELESNFQDYKKHCYRVYHQQNQYQEIVKNLGPDEALILCDFSQNYEAKLGEEIQAMHFGASKNQITLHTGVVYWAQQAQSFCTISDCNTHDPPAIWAHLLPIIKLIKLKTPQVTTIHFYSDGPSSQYRQKKNFYLLSLFAAKLNLKFTTWSYFESGHGKGPADAIGGIVKRALDRRVSYGHDISNASQAHEFLNISMKSVQCIFVSKQDIDNINKLIPVLTPVPGTLKIHQILWKNTSPNQIYYRSLGCFCKKPELCHCYNLQQHKFPSITQSNQNSSLKENIITEHPKEQKAGQTKKRISTSNYEKGKVPPIKKAKILLPKTSPNYDYQINTQKTDVEVLSHPLTSYEVHKYQPVTSVEAHEHQSLTLDEAHERQPVNSNKKGKVPPIKKPKTSPNYDYQINTQKTDVEVLSHPLTSYEVHKYQPVTSVEAHEHQSLTLDEAHERQPVNSNKKGKVPPIKKPKTSPNYDYQINTQKTDVEVLSHPLTSYEVHKYQPVTSVEAHEHQSLTLDEAHERQPVNSNKKGKVPPIKKPKTSPNYDYQINTRKTDEEVLLYPLTSYEVHKYQPVTSVEAHEHQSLTLDEAHERQPVNLNVVYEHQTLTSNDIHNNCDDDYPPLPLLENLSDLNMNCSENDFILNLDDSELQQIPIKSKISSYEPRISKVNLINANISSNRNCDTSSVVIDKIEIIKSGTIKTTKDCSNKYKNKTDKENKTFKYNVISGRVLCNNCKEKCISHSMNRCIICLSKHCLLCSGGSLNKNYLCHACLNK